MQVTKTSTWSGETRTYEIPCLDEQKIELIRKRGIDPQKFGCNPAQARFVLTGITPEEARQMEDGISGTGLGLVPPSPKPKNQSDDGEL